jgi:hypothetical protein
MRAWVRSAVRGVGYLFGGFGLLALWFAAGILLEGITHLAGEGQRLAPDTPAQRRDRLILAGAFAGGGALGGGLWALSWVWTRETGRRVGLAALAGGAVFFAGVLCLFYGLLILAASIHATPERDPLYLWIGGGGVTAAPLLLVAGAWVCRNREAANTTAPPG